MTDPRTPANRAEVVEVMATAVLGMTGTTPTLTVAAAILAALEAAGVVLVPAKMTMRMLAAGVTACDGEAMWAAMVSASPYAPEDGR